jgi:hypothetical protein
MKLEKSSEIEKSGVRSDWYSPRAPDHQHHSESKFTSYRAPAAPRLGRNNVVQLQPVPSAARDTTETRDLFMDLVREALHGDVVGAIVIPLHGRARSSTPYTLKLAGLASSNATLAAGAMAACQVLVQELALEHAGLI